MNLLRRAAQRVLDLHLFWTTNLIAIYGKLGLYRRLYTWIGFPGETPEALEKRVLGDMLNGLDAQHMLVTMWLSGQIDLLQLKRDHADWFDRYFDKSVQDQIALMERGRRAVQEGVTS